MNLCACPVEGNSRPVLLEIGDYSRVISVQCPNCGEYVLDPLDSDAMDRLHANDLLVTLTVIREEQSGEGEPYVWYSLAEPASKLLAEAS